MNIEIFFEGEKANEPDDQLLITEKVRPGGFEPPTYGLEVRCSIQLSYGRLVIV